MFLFTKCLKYKTDGYVYKLLHVNSSETITQIKKYNHQNLKHPPHASSQSISSPISQRVGAMSSTQEYFLTSFK